MADKQKRAGGRPPLYVDEPGRVGHSVRLRASTDAVIRAAAKANSRSIAGEIEARIEASLASETTEAMMRRVLVEDREAQRAALMAEYTSAGAVQTNAQGQITSLDWSKMAKSLQDPH